ncbi:secretion protein F [Anaeromicropila herbilytica]|uniref:Type II secretion system protein GspF domain-containing protein n=1 Tax=Anaeromicropila herbilytica TaxID=2785025 RepID=A0A7R7EQ08_9FIRM|nr:secretion protein F [Anaeromicropila herbilytica]BCN32936.1 hypothetical protein bsdtb5_42310 [Anaeromicropila herbilytica]
MIGLYPIGFFLYDKGKCIVHIFYNTRVRESLEMLNVGEKRNVILRLYYCKKIVVCYIICFSFLFIGIVSIASEKSGDLIGKNRIDRPDYGEGDKKVNVDVVIDKAGEYVESNMDIDVNERRYNEELRLEVIKKAEEYIDQYVLGENKSANEVNQKLNLITVIPGTSISVDWEVDNTLIDLDGELLNKGVPEEGQLTKLIATLEYYDTKAEYSFYLNILPKVITEKEKLISLLKNKIKESSEKSLEESRLALPKSVGKDKVYYSQKKDTTSYFIPVFGVFIAIAIFFLMDKDLGDKLHKRNIQLAIDYPEIVNKFTLLLSAGMTVSAAWGKIVKEYEGKIKEDTTLRRYAYDEMLITWHELTIGISEGKAIENFGRRVKYMPYLKFSSLVTQNIKKGTKDLLELLELEAMNAFEERKELAKRLGEEAGTKLLIPMMIMLVIVLLIIMIPAFMTMGM